MTTRTTRSIRKREREETTTLAKKNHGQQRTFIPMILIVGKIFPFVLARSWNSRHMPNVMDAFNLALVCKMAYHWFRNEKRFWEPMLIKTMKMRFDRFDFHFASLLRNRYEMWPEHILAVGGVIGVVQSKYLFCLSGAPETTDLGAFINYERDPARCACLSFYSRNSCVYIERLPFGDSNYQGGIIIPSKKSRLIHKDRLPRTEYLMKTTLNLTGPESWERGRTLIIVKVQK